MTLELLALHPKTRAHAEAFLSQPSHALLICGPQGSGKRSLAIAMAEQALRLGDGQLADHPYAAHITPIEGKAISIEAVRDLEHFLSLRVPSKQKISRAIIIEDAHLLTLQAQNALLKTLEEPPTGTIIFLTARSEASLLPTIRSRSQLLQLIRPDVSLLQDFFFSQGYQDVEIKRAFALSGGLTGLTQALLSQTEHPLLPATEKAREILSGTTYQRLILVDELSKQKSLCEDILFILQQMAHVSLQSATLTNSVKWQKIMTASYEAAEAFKANAQPKLVLTNLMLQLS